jgi:CheY-like chemotaxis protein
MAEHRPPVLIVEDDALVAGVLTDLLREHGYDVVGPVASRLEALQLLEDASALVALIDLGLRDSDRGTSLLKQLLAMGVPCAVHTGSRRPLDDELATVPWLLKPASPEEILNAVGELALARRRRDGDSLPA